MVEDFQWRASGRSRLLLWLLFSSYRVCLLGQQATGSQLLVSRASHVMGVPKSQTHTCFCCEDAATCKNSTSNSISFAMSKFAWLVKLEAAVCNNRKEQCGQHVTIITIMIITSEYHKLIGVTLSEARTQFRFSLHFELNCGHFHRSNYCCRVPNLHTLFGSGSFGQK